MKYFSHSILLLICFTVLIQTGYACICLPYKQSQFENEVKKTEYIFVGEVTEIQEEVSLSSDKNKKFFIKFKVVQNFKGAEDKEITIIQFKRNIPCGTFINFKKKKKYLVSANTTNENEIRVNNTCLRTQRFNKNQVNT